jgi:hypothetical protein
MNSPSDIRLSDVLRYLHPGVGFAVSGSDIILWESDNPPPSADEIASVKIILHRIRLHENRRQARTRAETGGFFFNGHPFDSDRDSILRIANAATTALTANLVGAPFATEWHCADGYDMPLDAAGVMAMQGALAAHGQACHDRSSALRAMIDAPEADLDALAAEIKTGWPG